MTDLQTERLTLRPVEIDEAERIVARRPGPEDSWASDFPFDGDVMGATMFLRATAAHGEQRPFGHYLIIRTSDGQAIGGIGFKGQPAGGTVEIGYGLAPSGRGHGFAAEAARALVGVARAHGVSRVVADTDKDNVPSQLTLERAGFTRVGSSESLLLYALEV
ncbi:GNAT family N-acetyltransferase [Humibacillus xanthopallidus]|uniref:RimJ/RimL family protein N-acetyltransferase n=1 Tax=Humibacillus xanthopallidus TaxID=412689 RepID=A0A543I2U6_9MICO|nr:GNAT family N-acetyltransferase [Humibacillus xanthopallidus]TQM64919.1 RimJ/RimL family protein N-acetyltransferase [Humibacillus xanthopallidus]